MENWKFQNQGEKVNNGDCKGSQFAQNGVKVQYVYKTKVVIQQAHKFD